MIHTKEEEPPISTPLSPVQNVSLSHFEGTSQEMTWPQQKWANITELAYNFWDRFSTSASGPLGTVSTGVKQGVTSVGDSYGSVAKMVDNGKNQPAEQVPVEVSLWPEEGICAKVPESAHDTCAKTASFFGGIYDSAADTAGASRELDQ